MPNLPLLTASTTCQRSLSVDLDARTGANDVDFEYSRENCTTQYFVNASSSQVLPVTFTQATTSSSSPVTASTTFSVLPTFTGGEIMLVTLALLAFMLWILVLITKSLSVINTKRKYLQYNGGDVEQREDN
jgi:hypothetical protein